MFRTVLQWIGRGHGLLHRVWTPIANRGKRPDSSRDRPAGMPGGTGPMDAERSEAPKQPQAWRAGPSGCTDWSFAKMMIRCAALYNGLQADNTSRS